MNNDEDDDDDNYDDDDLVVFFFLPNKECLNEIVIWFISFFTDNNRLCTR